MQGIVLINKGANMTSFDVVKRLQKACRLKVGHAGTLDPQATGVLVCLVNNTKVLNYLDMSTKRYHAKCLLGKRTDTLDIWGNVLEEKPVGHYSHLQIKAALESLLGTSKQIVPMVSAKKINGKKLYEYHRQNEVVKQPEIDIVVSEIRLINYENHEIEFEVTVSSGTYIRSLCEKIAEILETIGCMSYLVRTQAGPFKLEECHELEDVIENVESYCLNIKEGLRHYPTHEVEDPTPVYHGKALSIVYQGERLLLTYQKEALALVEYKREENCYRVLRGLWL